MVFDLLPIEGNLVRFKVQGHDKEALLNEKDDLWVSFRYQHIADVLEGLGGVVESIKQRNPGAVKLAGGERGQTSVNELGAIVKALPEYQAQLER